MILPKTQHIAKSILAKLLAVALVFNILSFASAEAAELPAPTNVVATPSNDRCSIKLSWQNNSPNAFGFEVSLKKEDGTYQDNIQHAGAGATSVDINSPTILCDRSSYTFGLRAYGIVNYSAYADSNTVTYVLSPPTVRLIDDNQIVSIISANIVNDYVSLEKKTQYADWQEIDYIPRGHSTPSNCYPGENCQYRARAIKDGAPKTYSEYSNIASFNNPSNPLNMRIVGQAPVMDDIGPVLYYNNYLFSGSKVIDVSDSANPLIKKVIDFGSTAISLANSNTYLYAGLNNKTMSVFNISDPLDPKLIKTITLNEGPNHILAKGSKLYVSEGEAGLVIYNISDPSNPNNPVIIDTPGMAMQTDVSGNIAAVADRSNGVQLIDLTTNAIVSNYTYNESNRYSGTLAFKGNILFAQVSLDTKSYFHSIDIANPLAPVKKGEYSTMGPISGTSVSSFALVSGDSMYLSTHSNRLDGDGLEIVNIANPNLMSKAGFYVVNYIKGKIALDNNRLFLTTMDLTGSMGNLYIFDVANPANPIVVSHVRDTKGEATTAVVETHNGYLYQAGVTGGMYIHSLADPKSPAHVKYINNITTYYNFEFKDNVMYTNNKEKITLYDISNPVSPTKIKDILLPETAYSLKAISNKLYVADGTAGLIIYDISNPSDPKNPITIDTPGCAASVDVNGDIAAVSDCEEGIQFINLAANPPTITGNYRYNSGNPRLDSLIAVLFKNSYLYINSDYSHLVIVKVSSNPANPNPVKVGVFKPTPTKNSSYILNPAMSFYENNYIVISARGDSLTQTIELIDISDPSNPKSAELINSGINHPYGLSVYNGLIYVSEHIRGLVVVDPHDKEVTLAKSLDKTTASPGEIVTVTLTLKNISSNAMHAANITDIIPTGTTYYGQAKLNGIVLTDNPNDNDGYGLVGGKPTLVLPTIVPVGISGDTQTLTYQIRVN